LQHRRLAPYRGSAAATRTSLRPVPAFLVPIEGDAARAAGLLAVAGIQNLVHTAEVPPTAIARLIADDGKQAVQRVSSALDGKEFTVQGAAEEG
jgi:hypothetical protein